MTRTIAILLFPDVEVLDFAGPYEVFTTASRVHARTHPHSETLFDVATVAHGFGAPVRARAGLEVLVDHSIAAHPAIDVLIVPGGVVTATMQQADVLSWIGRVHVTTQITASVCTGAFLLAGAGLLDGRTVTTHWEDIAELRATFPALTVDEGCRWVDEGDIVTSAGISAGIDMSLHLVERLAGRVLAEATARQMDVVWHENP